MLFLKIPSGAHPWLSGALWTTSAVAGAISIAITLSVLLDSRFAGSGISIFRFNFTSLLPTQFLYERDLALFDIPEASSEGVPPIVATAVAAATSGLQAAQTAVSSALEAAATDATTAAQSGLSTVMPKNMSIGLSKVCFGWENNSTQDCHSLPFNISSTVPSTLGALNAPLQQLQDIEKKVVSTVLETVHRSLIAGIILMLIFSLLFLFWEFPNDLWRRAIMTPLGFACLVVPFLISTAVMFVVQSDIRKKFDDSSLISVQDGGASKLILVGFIFSIVMFAATVATMVI